VHDNNNPKKYGETKKEKSKRKTKHKQEQEPHKTKTLNIALGHLTLLLSLTGLVMDNNDVQK
jgi:hypothetical protein